MKRITAFLLIATMIAAALCGCSLFNSAENATVTLDQTELSLTVGDSATLSAGDAVKVRWSSADDKIAAVNGGVISAKSAGSTVITASLENGASAECRVTVADKLITSITLSAGSTRLGLGKTIQLSATFAPPDASDTALTWSSEDENIASVNSDGYVTGCSEGVTRILCRSNGGVESACTVTVEAAIEPPTTVPTLPAPTQTSTEGDTPKPTHGNSSPSPAPSSGGFIFPDSSTRYLSESEVSATLASMSGSPVADSFSQDAINEIFARNGYVFRTPSIRAYYESQPWYRANPNFSVADLSDIESYNINLIGKH